MVHVPREYLPYITTQGEYTMSKIQVVSADVINGIVKADLNIEATVAEGKCTEKHKISFTLRINDPLNSILVEAGKSIRIDVQKVRDKGDAAVRALNGSVINYSSIRSMIALSDEEKLEKMSVEQLDSMMRKMQAILRKKTSGN
jgi:hypothetical protein